jgi:hypothetical protein
VSYPTGVVKSCKVGAAGVGRTHPGGRSGDFFAAVWSGGKKKKGAGDASLAGGSNDGGDDDERRLCHPAERRVDDEASTRRETSEGEGGNSRGMLRDDQKYCKATMRTMRNATPQLLREGGDVGECCETTGHIAEQRMTYLLSHSEAI